jgi:hypothetical protein
MRVVPREFQDWTMFSEMCIHAVAEGKRGA